MNKLPIYEIVWLDAHGSDGTIFQHEIDHRPYEFTTVGYLVRSDEAGVSVAAEQGQDEKVRDVTFIPRAMIVKEIPVLKPKRKTSVKKVPNPTPLTDSTPT